MKKIFANGWVTLGFMLLTAVADLIAVPGGFGAGFVLTFAFMVTMLIRAFNDWGDI